MTETGEIVLAIGTGQRSVRIYISEEEAEHISNRLQAAAKSQGPFSETLVTRNDQ